MHYCPLIKLAVETKSKKFLATTPVQSIVNAIYAGDIVFTTASNRSLVVDNYKTRDVQLYDSSRAGFLDHYRLV